ncbi:hypothetical protein ACFX14_022421 [Malus domestica]
MIGRKCQHCGTETTPQWRPGPHGNKTLCDACEVRYRKSGKLVPEYCPASSPTFSRELHSNNLSKVMYCENLICLAIHEVGSFV